MEQINKINKCKFLKIIKLLNLNINTIINNIIVKTLMLSVNQIVVIKLSLISTLLATFLCIISGNPRTTMGSKPCMVNSWRIKNIPYSSSPRFIEANPTNKNFIMLFKKLNDALDK